MVQTRKAQREAITPTLGLPEDDSEPTPASIKRRASPSASLTRGQAPKRARRGAATPAAAATAGAAAVAAATQHAGASTPADSTDAAQQPQPQPQPPAESSRAPAAQCAACDQVTWEAQLGGGLPEDSPHCVPAPRCVDLDLPTSANAAVWQEYGDDTDIFNVGLVADTSDSPGTPPVAVAAVDLLAASDWFRLLVGMRSRMGGGAGGREGGLRALPLPLRVPRSVLVTIVQGIYEGRLRLTCANVEAVLRVADACQMPAVLKACEEYLLGYINASEGDGAPFCLAAWRLAEELQRAPLARSVARHVIGIGMYSCRQRASLRVMVNSQRTPADVVALLREAYASRVGRGCSELMVLQAIFWMQRHQVASDRHQPAGLLDHVRWERLHRLELEALAHHASGMPESCPLAAVLHRRLLPLLADSSRAEAPPGSSYLLVQLDVEQIEAQYSEAASVIKSAPATIEGRQVYIRCWHKVDVGWGLYISPLEKTTRLSSFCSQAAHFFLSHNWAKDGRLVHLRQPYSLRDTTKGSNLGMAGQITKMLQQHGDNGAVCTHPSGRRTVTVGIQLSLLDREAQEAEATRDGDTLPAAAGSIPDPLAPEGGVDGKAP